MLFWLQHKWTGVWLLILAFGGLTLFLYGFFPLKYHSGKIAHLDDLPNFIDGVSIDGHEVYNSGSNNVILMVIDGLRYDFATEEYMPYTGQLIKNKSACIYVSVAEPPTVTMPRIKAMMTGSVSTFADVALNFGAPAVKGDSVLRVASSRGRHSVLYGDDTWLRLFPGLWTESDGTTSFFVTDYTEVDNNVTRHLDTVLAPLEDKKPKFDFLVLHYLGLDHIGHLEGARSPKIKPKLLEMDDIVKKIHTAMQTWDSSGVLIVCGDHGMRDGGGHGGASSAEVLVPLLVLKTTDFRCPHDSGPGPIVAQVDIAPTIAWLLNAPIPGDSTGKFLPSLLPADVRQHLYLLHVNALHNVKQGVPTDSEYYKQLKRAEAQFGRYLSTGQQSAARIAKEFYDESLAAISQQLADATTDFDLFALALAAAFLYLVLAALACVTLYSLQPENRRRISVTDKHKTKWGTVVAFAVVFAVAASTLTLACFISETKSRFCSFRPLWSIAFLATAVALSFAYFLVKTGLERIRDLSTLRDLNAIDFLLIVGTLFHAWSFFGTSFIEEEHMTWYFFWNTLMFWILVRTIVVVVMYFSKRWSGATEVQDKPDLENRMSGVGIGIVPKWVLLIGLHRYLRTMNQTGDRWLFLPDTADWLNAPENSVYLQAHLIIGTLLTFGICLRNIRFMNNHLKIHTVITVLSTLCILLYRISSDAIQLPFEAPKWDQVKVVEAFWWLLAAQTIFELIAYTGVFSNGPKFYSRPKVKGEDYFHDEPEPWRLEDARLRLARSLTHIMYNQMMLIVILLMRPHNVIMVPSVYLTCLVTSKCLEHTLLDSRPGRNTEAADQLSQTLAHIWIGAVFYFYQGNSNSLASVDLGSGYVGLSEYSPLRVAARMGLHAYAGPALSGAHLFCSLPYTDMSRYRQAVWRVSNIMALQRVYQLVIYCVIAIIFRHHLFVWSVFSPKLLYDFVATIFTIQALLTIAEIVLLTHVVGWISRWITYRGIT